MAESGVLNTVLHQIIRHQTPRTGALPRQTGAPDWAADLR